MHPVQVGSLHTSKSIFALMVETGTFPLMKASPGWTDLGLRGANGYIMPVTC